MYLLDTNVLSELIKKRPNQHLLSKLKTKPSETLFTSIICVMVLRFGSMLRDDFEFFWDRVNEEILSNVNCLRLGEKEAIIAGDILADMRKTGKMIGIEDVLIAASAITNKFIMVTANIKHFSRIENIRVENWLAAD